MNFGLFLHYLLEDRKSDFQSFKQQDYDYFDEVVRWNYTWSGGGGKWPPPWMNRSDRLEDHGAIKQGLNSFFQSDIAGQGRSLLEQLEQITLAWPRLREVMESSGADYDRIEKEFWNTFQVAILPQMASFDGLHGLEKEWDDRYNTLSRAYGAITHDFGELETEVGRIALFQEDDLTNSFRRGVSNALERVRESNALILLPERQDDLVDSLIDRAESVREKTTELIEENIEKKEPGSVDVVFGKEYNLIEDIQHRLNAHYSDIKTRLTQRDLVDQLDEFSTRFDELSGDVMRYRNRFPAFEPVDLPDSLVWENATWPQLLEDYRQTQVSFIHDDLERLCRNVSDRLDHVSRFSISIPKDRIKEVKRLADQGI
ncbi:MAG: hypothetical protein AAF492_27655, partial [Verrucomicrobiota bacterium]